MEKCWTTPQDGVRPRWNVPFLGFIIKWELSKTGTKRRGEPRPTDVNRPFGTDKSVPMNCLLTKVQYSCVKPITWTGIQVIGPYEGSVLCPAYSLSAILSCITSIRVSFLHLGEKYPSGTFLYIVRMWFVFNHSSKTGWVVSYYFSIKQFNNPISPGNTGNDPRR